MTISEQAPAAENVSMFLAGTDIEKMRQFLSLPCGAVGPSSSWQRWYATAHPGCWTRHPQCNRMMGHDGPHRTYNTKAGIRAEWHNPGIHRTT